MVKPFTLSIKGGVLKLEGHCAFESVRNVERALAPDVGVKAIDLGDFEPRGSSGVSRLVQTLCTAAANGVKIQNPKSGMRRLLKAFACEGMAYE